MIRLNVIAVYHSNGQHVLMCLRRKNPYQGKYNFVGGKIEAGEDELSAAYRELQEETGITPAEITLTHVMDFRYAITDIELQVYAGTLRHEVALTEEANTLCWMLLTEDFFDVQRFAGEGNIGHIMETIRQYAPHLMHAEEDV